jgi:hypothetical protein
MARRQREVTIPKENVSFWLDRNGFWHNEKEQFENERIIHYFHSCIKKDALGFHLAQRHRDYLEKVYFPYEDTPLFVFDVIKGKEVTLVLNTRKRIRLRPKKLFTRSENLYMQFGQEEVKFTEHSLVKIADMLHFDKENDFIRFRGRKYRIEER